MRAMSTSGIATANQRTAAAAEHVTVTDAAEDGGREETITPPTY